MQIRPTIQRILFTIAGLLVLATGCQSTPPEPPAPPLTVDIEFVSKWWSADQMDGLNVDDPPQKNTEVILERWDASDPVGTPHPKEFDIVAIVSAPSDMNNISIDTVWRWSIGDLSESTKAQWTPWESGNRLGPFTVFSGTTKRVVLHTVQIDSLQKTLYEQDRWPSAFEARAFAIVDGTIMQIDDGKAKRIEILIGD